jgi:hypothetical protein
MAPTEADGAERSIASQRAAAGVEPQPPTGGFDQAAGAGAVRFRVAAAAAKNDQTHTWILPPESGEGERL